MTCMFGFPLFPGSRKWGFASWSSRSRPSMSHHSGQSQPSAGQEGKNSVATGQNIATHHQGEPVPPEAAPANDKQQPSFLGGLAKTAGNTVVESSIAGVVGVGINTAFAAGSQPEPAQSGPVNSGMAGAAGRQSSPPGPGAEKATSQHGQSGEQAASQPSQSGEQAKPQSDKSGEKEELHPNQDLENVGSKPSQSGEDPYAAEVSGAARRARLRKYMATTLSSSACKTAPLVTAALTILALVLR